MSGNNEGDDQAIFTGDMENGSNTTVEALAEAAKYTNAKMLFARGLAKYLLLITIVKLVVVVFNYIVGWIIPVLNEMGYNLYSIVQIALIAPIVLLYSHYDSKSMMMVDKRYEEVFTPIYIITAFVFFFDVAGLAKMCWAFDQNAKAGWIASNVTMNLLPWSIHTALGGEKGWVTYFLIQSIAHVALTILFIYFLYRIRSKQSLISRVVGWMHSEFGIGSNKTVNHVYKMLDFQTHRALGIHKKDKGRNRPQMNLGGRKEDVEEY